MVKLKSLLSTGNIRDADVCGLGFKVLQEMAWARKCRSARKTRAGISDQYQSSSGAHESGGLYSRFCTRGQQLE